MKSWHWIKTKLVHFSENFNQDMQQIRKFNMAEAVNCIFRYCGKLSKAAVTVKDLGGGRRAGGRGRGGRSNDGGWINGGRGHGRAAGGGRGRTESTH